MAKPFPDELNVPEFDDHVGKFEARLKEVFAYLRSTAKNAGADVFERRYKPQAGCGTTYYSPGFVGGFCQLHPKSDSDHVQVLIEGTSADTLRNAGFESTADRLDEQPWFPIRTMPEAVRAVSLILQAYDTRRRTLPTSSRTSTPPVFRSAQPT